MICVDMYTAGDIIHFRINNVDFFGEVLGVDDDKKVEVSRLKQTRKQEGRIWEFVADNKWSAIESSYVVKHIKVGNSAGRPAVVQAWKDIGFVPGGDGMTFCKVEDEENTTLPMYEGDEERSDDEDDEDTASSNPRMHGYASDGFVVPDDEGSDFEFANPDELDDEAAQFVRETHEAVREYDKWVPKDKKARAIKAFIDNVDHKASIETDNKRFLNGKTSISTSKPPLKKRKKNE